MKDDRTIERLRSMDRAIMREQMVDSGFFNKPSGQVHRNKKAYNRKAKHPNKEY